MYMPRHEADIGTFSARLEMNFDVAVRNSLDRRRVQEAVLSRAIMDYEPKKSEWMAWCAKREFDDGSLVEEGKLLLFLQEVVEPRLQVNGELQTRAVDELEAHVKTMEILWGLQKVNPTFVSSITHHPRGPAVSTYLDSHRRREAEISRDLAVDHNTESAPHPPFPLRSEPTSAAKEKRKRTHLEPSLKETGVRCNLCKMRLGYASFKNHWERLHKKTLQITDPDIVWNASFHKKYSTPLKGTSTTKKMQATVAELHATVSSLIGVVTSIATHFNVAIPE